MKIVENYRQSQQHQRIVAETVDVQHKADPWMHPLAIAGAESIGGKEGEQAKYLPVHGSAGN